MKPAFALPPRVDQLLAGFAEGDAISSEALALQRVFRGWGLESELYVDDRHTSEAMRRAGVCRPLEAYRPDPAAFAIHHYSIGSPAIERFLAAPGRRILIYHNITPAPFFQAFDNRVTASLDEARAGLRATLPRVDACWAVSEYNAAELRALGRADTRVLPLVFSPATEQPPPDPRIRDRFAVPMTNILFVGRIAPNKGIEDLLPAFDHYHRVFNRRSRLIVVGSERSAWRYAVMLRLLAAQLGTPNLYFESFASPAGLSAYYQAASLFVTLSRHEGYCLPLLEAMARGVPVLARRVGGVPEALGDAGVMVEAPDPGALAALMDELTRPTELRARVLAAQQARLAVLAKRDLETEIATLLAPLRG